MEIKDFVTNHFVNWIKIENGCPNCGLREFLLIRNQRADASYYGIVCCKKCKTEIKEISWEEYYKN